jgi:hypothetical protein
VGSKRRRNRDRERNPMNPGLGTTPLQPDIGPPAVDPETMGASGISSVSGLSPGAIGISPIMFDPVRSTPLDTGESAAPIPAAALWAMKDRMHSHRLLDPEDPGSVNCALGTDDSALYFIDDGRDHCMMSRLVGRSRDGIEYCLVGRIALYRYEQLLNEEIVPADAFSDASDISLCGVFQDDAASNVILVEHYRAADAVPRDYLPPSLHIEFSAPEEDER